MKTNNNFRSLISIVLISSACLISCKPGNIYSDSEKIPAYTWNAANIVTFEVPVEDTTSAFDINLIIRTDNSYPYRNLFLFIKTTSPDKMIIKDTVEYLLADEKGNWYGSGLGDVNDLYVPFKTNVRFPAEGIYSFSIQHGMRDKDLDGVTDIGIQVRKRTK
ncbi:MAG: gliding motility lipoprotein GldH [Bacteroidota bacterium]|nr:gliding motility lipoprotein GldH [Bacteroidota bacterium]